MSVLNHGTKFQFKTNSLELSVLVKLIADQEITEKTENLKADEFIQLIQYHRIGSQVYQRVEKIENFPKELKVKLQEIYKVKQDFSLSLTRNLFQLLELFKKNDIEVIPLKGPFLAYRLYSDFTMRTFRDLDILIAPEKLDQARKLLMQHNYQLEGANYASPKQKNMLLTYFHHLNFVQKDQLIPIELHWKLFASRFISEEFQLSAWQQRETFQINKIPIKVLQKEDEFIFLCVHGVRHLWFRFLWLLDLKAFLHHTDSNFLQRVLEKATLYELEAYVLQSLDMLEKFDLFALDDQLKINIKNDKKVQKITKLSLKKIKQSIKRSERNKRATDSVNDFFTYYYSIYLLIGMKGVWQELRIRRIKPENWTFFAFSDKLFFFNTVFSRFIWVVRKLKIR